MHPQRGEQVHRAVARVLVVTPGARALARHWQRVGAGQALGLDRGLLIDREHQRVLRRVQVQAADLAAALLEVRLVEIGHHPVLGAVRLDLRAREDHVRLGLRDPHLLAQLTVRPALAPLPGLGLRWTGARLRDQKRPLVRAVRQRAPRPRRVLEPRHPQLRVAPTPLDHRRQRTADLCGDLLARATLSCIQHDPRALDHPYLGTSRARDPLELETILVAHHDPLACSLQSHRQSPSSPTLSVKEFATAPRKPLSHHHLTANLQDDTRGDPMSPLRWCSKSLQNIASALQAAGHQVSDRTSGKLLRGLGFRLHANSKTREGKDHPDRDAQFRHINETTRSALGEDQPVISVDAKKRELVGDFKAVGREYEPTGRPVEVRCHDFKDKDLGHAIPYGVLDFKANEGMVSVGVTNDTSAFAVNSIRAWWQHLGQKRYPKATCLTITADGGGSNSSRTRLWKTELQKLANELALPIRVCHFPPGTSKWNKIEHRLFSYVSLNWRGKPLETLQVIIDLIGATTTSTGLKVYARLDPGEYEKGIKVTDAELAAVNIERDPFHPDWNYTIHPIS